jgi:hypothetical protein
MPIGPSAAARLERRINHRTLVTALSRKDPSSSPGTASADTLGDVLLMPSEQVPTVSKCTRTVNRWTRLIVLHGPRGPWLMQC